MYLILRYLSNQENYLTRFPFALPYIWFMLKYGKINQNIMIGKPMS